MLSLVYIYFRLQLIYWLGQMFRVKQSLYFWARSQSLTHGSVHLRLLTVNSWHLLLILVKRDWNTIVVEIANVSGGGRVIVLVVSLCISLIYKHIECQKDKRITTEVNMKLIERSLSLL